MGKKSYLRSTEWFGKDDKMGFVHRSWLRNQGHPDHMFKGKPVIGICNTWSDLTPCNGHLREFAEVVKRGVYEAGGFPLEFPVMSLGETIMKPGTMLWRNLVLVKTGDIIELDVEKRSLTLLVPEEELKKRRSTWTPPKPVAERGYVSMFIKHVEQADKGCDFDFLKGGSGSVVLRDLH